LPLSVGWPGRAQFKTVGLISPPGALTGPIRRRQAPELRLLCKCGVLVVVEVLQGARSCMLAGMTEPQGRAGDHEHNHRVSDDHFHGNRDHVHGRGAVGWLRHLPRPHSHEGAGKVDAVMEGSAEGVRALWVSLAVLGGTALVQAAVVAVSGSVALLGDTLHNAADALTAVPLGIAFLVGRRPPTRRYTYGYGRAEDLAGVVIVVFIAMSSVLAAYEAVTRLAHPRQVSNLLAVAAAALIGFSGNEVVARYRIRVGRKIGSAALVADGLHARTDGFTSLAVLLGVGGVAAGWDWADPVVGLVITVAILAVLRQAAWEIYRRLMDAVDPALVDQVEQKLRATPGVLGVGQVRLRWIGHHLRAECEVIVDGGATAVQAHQVAVDAEHGLLHALPRLAAALVHADPQPGEGDDLHAILASHR
jgi:cation diffusion facilitator family transporter